MKFRKKPIVIDAAQYFASKTGEEPLKSHPGITLCPNSNRDYVVTIHGDRAHLSDGDWIIPEPKPGHYYPCKPDIFAATYEPVENEEQLAPAEPLQVRFTCDTDRLLAEFYRQNPNPMFRRKDDIPQHFEWAKNNVGKFLTIEVTLSANYDFEAEKSAFEAKWKDRLEKAQ